MFLVSPCLFSSHVCCVRVCVYVWTLIETFDIGTGHLSENRVLPSPKLIFVADVLFVYNVTYRCNVTDRRQVKLKRVMEEPTGEMWLKFCPFRRVLFYYQINFPNNSSALDRPQQSTLCGGDGGVGGGGGGGDLFVSVRVLRAPPTKGILYILVSAETCAMPVPRFPLLSSPAIQCPISNLPALPSVPILLVSLIMNSWVARVDSFFINLNPFTWAANRNATMTLIDGLYYMSLYSNNNDNT